MLAEGKQSLCDRSDSKSPKLPDPLRSKGGRPKYPLFYSLFLEKISGNSDVLRLTIPFIAAMARP